MSDNKEAVFRDWIHTYSDMLYAHAIKSGLSEDTAKDILQDTFLSAWKNMDTYEGRASVKNWLFVLLKNKITDHFRKPSVKRTVEWIQEEHKDFNFFDEEGHWRKGMYPKNWIVDQSDPVELKHFMEILSGCRTKLKEIQNAVFVMKYVEGKLSEEICAELAITAANYWVLMHRAKVQLRACLEKNWLNA